MARRGPVVLCILDGWGLNPSREANAVALGDTPNFDRIWAACPHATLAAHGPAVGLPEGQMGNSEVGHTNIGAGRVVWMDLPRIDNAIADGSFARNAELARFVAAVKASGGTAHVAGLASPGGVHAHQRHIVAAARAMTAAGVPVAVHAFLDGRDVPPRSADGQIAELVADLPAGARVATVSGRFYAMDRDKRWDRVALALAAVLRGEGPRAASAVAAVAAGYARGESDEFVTPTVIGDYAGARDGDGLFFANFRADRARQILGALVDPEFDGFPPGPRPRWAALLGMVEYSDRLNAFMPAMFPAQDIANTLGAFVAGKGLRQFRLAETEKYPHVTFFLNGGVETPYPGEERHMAPSPKVRTYDLAPEMAAAEVTEHLVAAIRSRDYALIVVNYANPDMVGHTGDLAAAIKAVEAVDHGLGQALQALHEVDGAMIVTADHGNCEVMVDPLTGGPHTAHTLNPVPVILVGGPSGASLRGGGRLADLAPTPARADGAGAARRDDRGKPDRAGMVRGLTLALAGLACAVAAGAGPTEPLAEATARLDRAEAALAAARRGARPDRGPRRGHRRAGGGAGGAARRARRGGGGGARGRAGARGAARGDRAAAGGPAGGRPLAAAGAGAAPAGADRRGAGGGDAGAAAAGAGGARGGARRHARGARRGAGAARRRRGRARGGAPGAQRRAGGAAPGDRRDAAGRAGARPGPRGDGAGERDADRARRGAGDAGGRTRRASRAPLAWPVAGTLLRRFQEPDTAGVRRPGIVMSAPPQSLVAAPADAAVRYAGPFLDYGYVVVLEAEPGTMVVLAGLAQLRVRAGERVRRGALLGLLGGRALDVEEYVMLADAGTGAGAGETLYIEIRHGRGPVDPEPWFAGRNG